jgi:hypothetical protein
MREELDGTSSSTAQLYDSRPHGPGRNERLASLGLVAFFVVCGTVLQLVRQVTTSAWDTIWAEDGFIFLADALNRSAAETLTEPYGGYIHVLPRLIAEVAAAFPLEHAALVFALASALAVSLVAAFVYFASASIIASPSLRFALASLVVLLPAAGSELLGNATNLHFHLMFGCFWAFIWRSESYGALASRSAVATVTALGDPLAVVFLPLVVWSAWTSRTKRGLIVPIAFGLALAVQATAILASGDGPERLTRFDIEDLLPLFALRVTGSLLVGDGFIDELWFHLGRLFSYGALVLVGTLVAVGLAYSDRRRRIIVLVCCGYAILLFSIFLVGRGSAGMRPGADAASWHLAGARFTLAPILLLTTALLVLVDGRSRTAPWRYLRGVAVALIAILAIANFSFKSERSLGPRWQPELANARARCTGPERAPIRVRVAPAPFGFFLNSTCDRIR